MPACAKPYVLLGVARSGTTSLAKTLDRASNGSCVVEPTPNLNVETRLMMEGRLDDPLGVISNTVIKRMREHQEHKSCIYGEKNVTYAPFIQYIFHEIPCRFVFIHRDGRDVVRSLINWHNLKFGSVYRECREVGDLNIASIGAAANLPVHLDTSDYSRPRPSAGSSLNAEWPTLGRAEMCAYYWAKINELYLDQLKDLPLETWISINYTSPAPEDVLQIADFLKLEGLELDGVRDMLVRRINSLSDRDVSVVNAYPKWTEWDGGQRRNFDRFAAEMMHRLGYYQNNTTRWKPSGYGQVWTKKSADLAWYEWMYQGRRYAHEDMLHWIQSLEETNDKIHTVTDFGCGRAVGYSEALSEKGYLGVDISQDNIEWCRQNRNNPNHKYLCADFISEEIPQKSDLVFSSGTIDNCYDIDEYLEAMIRSSNCWIYLTCYRGWFPDLEEHVYRYNEEHSCFYNDVALPKLLERLRALGCMDIFAQPLRTNNSEIPFETRVIARVPASGASDCV